MPSLLEEARPHHFTLDEYLRLSETGFFAGRRVELIDGEIIDMPSQKDRHTYAVTQATYWCHDTFPRDRFWVRVQTTLLTGDSSPEPDLAVVDYPAAASDEYASADRAILVIEVADATLLADTTTKMSLYASAKVQEYWVVNIPDGELIVHRQPTPSSTAKLGFTYGDVRRFSGGQSVSPLAAPSASIDPGILLG